MILLLRRLDHITSCIPTTLIPIAHYLWPVSLVPGKVFMTKYWKVKLSYRGQWKCVSSFSPFWVYVHVVCVTVSGAVACNVDSRLAEDSSPNISLKTLNISKKHNQFLSRDINYKPTFFSMFQTNESNLNDSQMYCMKTLNFWRFKNFVRQ